jgi:hypothetical protein
MQDAFKGQILFVRLPTNVTPPPYRELNSIQRKLRDSPTPDHVELPASLDCGSPLQLSAPQPAVEHRFEIE